MARQWHWMLALMMMVGSAHAAIEYADVTGGRVKGEVSEGLSTFKGIPFAAPPVGDLRWRVTQPVVPWSGTRAANTFAPACVQPWSEPNPSREDCLYLNVWTAAATPRERRPVMVWIHGGGFVGGWSWERLSDGTKLAREGVVLVTIAYRLGAMGFLAHPELTCESGGKGSGNYGLYDVVAALKWVQANIAQFGGDPSRVTIFGGSTGGVTVGLLAGSPAAKGLYSRAIAQGGSGFLAEPKDAAVGPTLSRAEKYGESLFRALGVSDLKAARGVSADAVSKAWQAEPPPIQAIIDGSLVPDYNVNLFPQGRFNDTPVLVGFTSDEAGDSADSMQSALAHWPCHDSDAQTALTVVYPPTSLRYVRRDVETAWPAWTWARLQTSKGKNPAYVYFFDIHDREHPFGAPHATEYPYVFGNFPKPPTASDEAASALIRKYWINFATRGDPNGPGLPVWKKFEEHSQAAMVLDGSPSTRRLPNLTQLRVLDATLSCTKPRN